MMAENRRDDLGVDVVHLDVGLLFERANGDS